MIRRADGIDRATWIRSLLKERWRSLAEDELQQYLSRVIFAERRCYPRRVRGKWDPGIVRMRGRLRRHRLSVLKEFVQRGGVVSPLLFAQRLPHEQWPGMVSLVKTPGFSLVGA